MIHIRNSALLAIISVALLSCSEFPPQKSYATQYFFEHRDGLEALVDAVSDDHLEFVDRGEVDGFYIRTANPFPERLIEKYKSLFENAGGNVYSVRVESSGTRIDDGAAYEARGRSFGFSYHYSADGSNLGVCDRDRLKTRCGFCSIPIDHPWYITYTWWSLDIILELEDKNSGDSADYQEREKRIAELLTKCHREAARGE